MMTAGKILITLLKGQANGIISPFIIISSLTMKGGVENG